MRIYEKCTSLFVKSSMIDAAESAKWCPSDVRKSDRRPTRIENLEGETLRPPSFLPLLPPLTPRVFTRRHRYAFSARWGAFPSTRTARVTDARARVHTPRVTLRRCASDAGRRRGVVTGRALDRGTREKPHFPLIARDASYRIFHQNAIFYVDHKSALARYLYFINTTLFFVM